MIFTDTMDVVDVMSYEAGYAAGYCEADVESYQRGYIACCINQQRKAKEKKKSREFVLKMRLLGILLLASTVIVAMINDGDTTLAILTVPLSLVLIFGRKEKLIELTGTK